MEGVVKCLPKRCSLRFGANRGLLSKDVVYMIMDVKQLWTLWKTLALGRWSILRIDPILPPQRISKRMTICDRWRGKISGATFCLFTGESSVLKNYVFIYFFFFCKTVMLNQAGNYFFIRHDKPLGIIWYIKLKSSSRNYVLFLLNYL